MFARLTIPGEKTSAHDFSSDVGNTSRGDDLLGSLFVSCFQYVWRYNIAETIHRLPIEKPALKSFIVQWLYRRLDAGMNTIHFIHEETAESMTKSGTVRHFAYKEGCCVTDSLSFATSDEGHRWKPTLFSGWNLNETPWSLFLPNLMHVQTHYCRTSLCSTISTFQATTVSFLADLTSLDNWWTLRVKHRLVAYRIGAHESRMRVSLLSNSAASSLADNDSITDALLSCDARTALQNELTSICLKGR